MSMASLPIWLEGILNSKYPKWRDVEYNEDGSARYMPAGVRVLEASLLRSTPAGDIVCMLSATTSTSSSARDTRVVAVSTHNPLGVTFAAGVYTSIFGSSKTPINSHYARQLFDRVKSEPLPRALQGHRRRLGRLADHADQCYEELGVDCVVEGRSESSETMALFRPGDPRRGAAPPDRRRASARPRRASSFPDKRTTFGVVEMTTGCGRRCQFCVPDLNPQIDVPKDKIMAGGARQRARRQQADLAGDRRHVHLGTGAHRTRRSTSRTARRCSTSTRAIVNTPGVEQHVLSHATIAPAVVDPLLIEKLSDMLLDKSPIQLADARARTRDTGRSCRSSASKPDRCGWRSRSCRARACRSRSTIGRASSFDGLEILNKNNWFPAMTLIVGSPGETDEDSKATLDLDLRSRAARALRVLHPVDLHAAPRHADGASRWASPRPSSSRRCNGS